MRLDIINYNGLKIINDAYNASPQSMEAAIDVFANQQLTLASDMQIHKCHTQEES